MYPWHHSLKAWAKGAGFQIDALGLVTLLGAEEMDRSIGRLMPSVYFDYLPLLGAFIVAGDRFKERKLGYTLYNISAGIVTTELSGWFSRWLRAQEFHKIRSKITWEVVDRPPRRKTLSVGLFLISLPLHGMLLALTVLATDWWGFANVLAMVISVFVRYVQVAENQAGINENIRRAEEDANKNLAKYEAAMKVAQRRRTEGCDNIKMPSRPRDHDLVKLLVVTEDSKVLTLLAPAFLVKPAFTAAPHIPNPRFYMLCRVIGWIAFAVHVVSIGMAALYTQICTIVLILSATVLTAYKVGSEDSQLASDLRRKWHHSDSEEKDWSCWVTSRLKATVSSYPAEYTQWEPVQKEEEFLGPKEVKTTVSSWPWSQRTATDLEHSAPKRKTHPVQERRQDLFAWLCLTPEEDERMVAWHMIPHSQEWKDVYLEKKEIHRQRTGGSQTPSSK
ncbi:uncharacterized protein N7503_005108 [Penicillium pulvis]|uniref:uncharacterized protein n=1 Tax=Penicillium pulvis TaxID=1562058 RepID=UPI0025480009|nr:uncharacterized protein N7503_005108 [Penicillium pulvis]KAJ5802658.1 hypothetical protein N7503_005108 [Penicillium pulvis]